MPLLTYLTASVHLLQCANKARQTVEKTACRESKTKTALERAEQVHRDTVAEHESAQKDLNVSHLQAVVTHDTVFISKHTSIGETAGSGSS